MGRITVGQQIGITMDPYAMYPEYESAVVKEIDGNVCIVRMKNGAREKRMVSLSHIKLENW